MAEHMHEAQKKETTAPEGPERTRAARIFTPAVDIIERENHIVILADMPGVDEKSVDITLERNILSIYGRIEPEIPEGYKLIDSEYGVGDYQRTFSLSDEVDRGKIQATVRDGVLKLMLPKAEAAKARRIEVKA